MTGLLVSVRDAAEARSAMSAGADLIDIKEPLVGALGAADARTWSEVVQAISARLPVSVALGELRGDAGERCISCATGIQYAKMGLSGCTDVGDWPARWHAAVQRLPRGVASVAVVYADVEAARAPEPNAVLDYAFDFGCRAVLVDTYTKTDGGLFNHFPRVRLAQLVHAARQRGLTVVLGGSLNLPTLESALSLSPDFVAVRGAVCQGPRTGSLDASLVREFARAIAAFGGHREQNSKFSPIA